MKKVTLLFTYLLITSISANAQFRICNYSWEEVWVSIGYIDSPFWYSKGWWKIQPKNCAIVHTNMSNRYIYYHAYNSVEKWNGDVDFCVKPKGVLMRSSSCNYEIYSMKQVDIDNATDFRLDLTSHLTLLEYIQYKKPKWSPKEIDNTFGTKKRSTDIRVLSNTSLMQLEAILKQP